MEGIIPMVYKALKKKKTRGQYKCLSSGAAQTYNNDNISVDLYAQQGYSSYQYATVPLQPEITSTIGGGGHVELITTNNGHHHHHHHRRHKSSIGDYSTGFSAAEDTVVVDRQPKQLVRFRSHRFFPCITAAGT